MNKLKTTAAICLLASAFAVPQRADATVSLSSLLATATLTVGDTSAPAASVSIPTGFNADGSIWIGTASGLPYQVTAAGSAISIAGTGLIDPSLGFSIGLTDNGPAGIPSDPANQFTFAFSVPMVPALSGMVSVNASLGETVTGSASTGAVLTPLFTTTMLNFIDTCSIGVDTGGSVSSAPRLSNTSSSNAAGVFMTSPSCSGTLTSVIAFSGNGGGTQYAFTGFLEAVPEPASMVILLSGVIGLTAATRRRAKAV